MLKEDFRPKCCPSFIKRYLMFICLLHLYGHKYKHSFTCMSLTTMCVSDMEFLEVLTEGLDRVVLVRGGGREVITIYS